MNAKQFMDLLKNLQKIMKCPSCGTTYQIEEIQFLGQVDGLLLLQMVCKNCELPVWMNFMANKDSQIKKEFLISDLSKEDVEKDFGSDISSNELIDFHSFLDKFEGNLKDIK